MKCVADTTLCQRPDEDSDKKLTAAAAEPIAEQRAYAPNAQWACASPGGSQKQNNN